MKNISDLKIVVIGGGTGLSTLLRGLKLFTSNINAIVTVADDGGSSGVLREDLNIPAPGDIRNCIVALANTEDILKKLFRYRFPAGVFEGHSFGNLFLAAMTEITGDFESAIEHMSSVLAVKGHVLPVTKENVHLKAILEDGSEVFGESNIPKAALEHKCRIKRICGEPEHVCAFERCIDVIEDADIVVLGPGSLYTSIIPNLLADGITDALLRTKAKKVYVCNVMTQPGETDGFTAFDHVNAIIAHSDRRVVDACIANTGVVGDMIMIRYLSQGATLIDTDAEKFRQSGIELIADNLVYIDENNKVRHDYIRLAQIIVRLALS